jgi:DNA-binding NarL/FixJ family response regulator
MKACGITESDVAGSKGIRGKGVANLTRREIEILELMAAGCRDKEIADKTFIPLHTAKTHVKHIFEKLNVTTKVQAILRAEELKANQQYLAVTAYKDAGWDRKKGKPVAVGTNKYVSKVLSAREITAQIEEAFAEGGYRVVSASVEKVLVGSFREVPLYEGKMLPGKVPYDAMVWFRLEKN